MEPSLDTVLEIKRKLDGSRAEFTCLACTLRPGSHAAVLYRLERDWHLPLAELSIPAGSFSTGFFWETRPFNLYHWMTPQGDTIGDYFNLAAATSISSDTVEWLDLVLDLCLVPGRDWFWLDENELPAYLEPGLRRQLEQGRRELSRHALQLSRHLGRLSQVYLAGLNGTPR